MATASLTLSGSRPRFGRRERTEIRAHFARDVLADMKAAYFADDRPWIVGFSGGKDSTALVQLLYYLLACLGRSRCEQHLATPFPEVPTELELFWQYHSENRINRLDVADQIDFQSAQILE